GAVAVAGWGAGSGRMGALARVLAGFALGLAPALVYHAAAFGSPLATPYRFHAERFANTRSVGSMYGGPFWPGLVGLLFSWRAGLLLYSPILAAGLLVLPGWVRQLGRR